MIFRLGDGVRRLFRRHKDDYLRFIGPKNADKRIIVGVKPSTYRLLERYSREYGPTIRLRAERLIRLGIATEQKLATLGLLEETPTDLLPLRSHKLPREYITINRQLYYLVKKYAARHRMTTKHAAEHLICLGIVAKYEIEFLQKKEVRRGSAS